MTRLSERTPCPGSEPRPSPAGPAGSALALALLATVVGTAATAAPAVPIPQDPAPDAPAYTGAPATPRPVSAPRPPRHPFMAPNPRNNIHNDPYMTDTYRGPGPLGRDPVSTSTFQNAECASVTFDSAGLLETVCVGVSTVTLQLLDPVTLEQLATYPLPPRRTTPGGGFNDFSGGGYFYLDHRDRAVVPTSTNHLVVVAQTEEEGSRASGSPATTTSPPRSAPRTRSSRSSPTGTAGWCS